MSGADTKKKLVGRHRKVAFMDVDRRWQDIYSA